ncbi:hypothetical protein CYMTET_21005 [Cymbomonas tetramitiformis]|uniref:EamA domain-containing protein n=1 Tax=Cymbomonas tetramitiformis TaxID=36881 RepID=A0AAE0G3N3_9CHLO|nr:hypothetical protein CYMTET_21005 [Cymbomonas tetramitiformis]
MVTLISACAITPLRACCPLYVWTLGADLSAGFVNDFTLRSPAGVEAALLMCTIPVIAILAQSCQTISLSSTVASKILPMSYLEVLFSTLIGTMLLNESMNLFQVIGAICVVASAVAYFFKPEPASQLPTSDTELVKLPEVEKSSERITYAKLIDSDELLSELNDDVEDCRGKADDAKL